MLSKVRTTGRHFSPSFGNSGGKLPVQSEDAVEALLQMFPPNVSAPHQRHRRASDQSQGHSLVMSPSTVVGDDAATLQSLARCFNRTLARLIVH